MLKTMLKVFALLALLAAVFAGGYVTRAMKPAPTTAPGRRVLYYVDPMHPVYKSDKPGIAPDCGMQLEPVYAGQLAAVSSAQLPGSVRIEPARQQLFGVRVGFAEQTSGSYNLRLLGRVAPDEGRIYKLNAGIE